MPERAIEVWGRALGEAAVRLAITLVVLLPVIHQAERSAHDLLITGVALVALVMLSARRLGRRESIRVLWACGVSLLGLQIFFATNQAIEPFSDFATQWAAAVRFVSEGVTLPDRPQLQRALPFYYPLVLVFGPAPGVYVTANVVMTTLSWLMTVWIAKRCFGWSGAAWTGVLLLFAYEPYLANNISSHDLLGAWGLLLFLLLLSEFEYGLRRGADSIARTVGFACVAAIVIAWTEWQRGIGRA